MFWSLLFFGLIIGLFIWVFHQYQDRIYKCIKAMQRFLLNLKSYTIMIGLSMVIVIICYLGFRVWLG